MGNFTFSYIKPAAVKRNVVGDILRRIEEAGYRIVAIKKTQFTPQTAKKFYGVHEGKPFFKDLMEFSISGPIVVMILEKEDAVLSYRKFIGATDPADAAEGTIRKLYGLNKTANAVHGSDSDENAAIEASFFFPEVERF